MKKSLLMLLLAISTFFPKTLIAQQQIRIFQSYQHPATGKNGVPNTTSASIVQERVNDWLSKYGYKVVIKEIIQSESENFFTITIFYEVSE